MISFQKREFSCERIDFGAKVTEITATISHISLEILIVSINKAVFIIRHLVAWTAYKQVCLPAVNRQL